MRKKALSTFAALVLVTGMAAGQSHPNDARGLNPNSSQTFGPDTVNLFNGNLTIAIPLGQPFHVNGALSYGLTLVYNSQVWERSVMQSAGGSSGTQSLPDRANTAGLGWRLTLGRLNPPQYPDEGSATLDAYDSPAGGRHGFFDLLHENDNPSDPANVKYSRDSTYMRYKSASRRVEFPDGSYHVFHQTSNGYPTQLVDGFGNAASIRYFASNAGEQAGNDVPPNQALLWVINDGHRTHRVYLKNTTGGYVANQPRLIDKVVLSAFGGTTATYQLRYNIDTTGPVITLTGCNNTDSSTAGKQIAFLTAVELPDGTSYQMPLANYHTTTASSGAPCTTGLLKRLALPTLGKIEWDYDLYRFNLNASTRSWRQRTTGVSARRLIDAAGNLVPGSWTIAVASPATYERTTTVTDPQGTSWRHYFSLCPRDCDPASRAFEYALPYTPLTTDGAGRFLSLEVISGGATVRTAYARYERDFTTRHPGDDPQENTQLNNRLASRRVLYGPPQQAAVPTGVDYADDNYSDFDGLGHYRRHSTDGNFPGKDAARANNNTRNTLVNYNPGVTSWPAAAPWMLNRFDFTSVSELGRPETFFESACIDPATGFLKGKRTHFQNGAGYSANDLVVIFDDLEGGVRKGNVVTESYFGGDEAGQALSTDAVGGSICNLTATLSNPRYRLTHTYAKGTRATSSYSGFGFKVLDVDVDAGTGLAATTRDSAGRATVLNYLASGRLNFVAPSGESAVNYTYQDPAGSSTLLRVTAAKGSNGPSTRSSFDGFGRPLLEERKLPTPGFSSRSTLYNALGWKTFVSEQGTAAFGTTIPLMPDSPNRFFDPFGRPLKVRPADGADPQGHDVILVYAQQAGQPPGDRTLVRTTRVAIGSGGTEGNAITVETYDRFGRLFEITEPNGTLTRYEYDAADRLRKVCQNRSGSTCGQTRNFTYDNRGFLTAEQNPEASATYLSYDARGHLLRMTDGAHALTMVYDNAERLTEVKATGGATLKSFTYASADASGDWQQVRTASRVNPLAGSTSVTVSETNTFQGPHGRISRRVTTVSTGEAFEQTFGYDGNGQLNALGYPKCTHVGCTQIAPAVFADVQIGHPNRTEIEAIYPGVTSGCAGNPPRYCPDDPASRGQAAVFVLRGKEGPTYVPPACTGLFADVSCAHPFARWIEELYRRGITGGCAQNPLRYCPDNPVTNAEIAVFLIQAMGGGSLGCSTAPFADVPCSSFAASFIAELARRQITSGCGGGNFCPGAAVTRAQMAGLITKAFNLPLSIDPNTMRNVALGRSSGFLTSVTSGSTTYGTLQYHDNLTVRQIVRANGTTDTIGIDPSFLPRPSSLGGSGLYSSWSSGAYAYDGSGNVKSIGSSAFVYDSLSRILSATVATGQTGGPPAIQKSFLYDVYGNVLSGPGPGSTPVNPATNRLQSPNSYDGAGNLIVWRSVSGVDVSYQYDAFNQMTRMTNGAEDWRYIYTASGERLASQRIGANHARWTLRDRSGAVLRDYVNDNGRWSVANDYLYRDGALLAAETNVGQRHFHLDHLGSPRLITRGSGYQAAYHVYYPFGMEATAENQDSVRLKFTGHERDFANLATSGDDLDYMHARHYSPLLGRFLSVDGHRGYRSMPQSWNRYAYALDRPSGFVDPDGYEPIPADLLPFYNSYFGSDLSGVNLHTGLSGAVITWMFGGQGGVAVGNQVYLSRSVVADIDSRSPKGIAFLGHELTHSVTYEAIGAPRFLWYYAVDVVGHVARGTRFKDIHDELGLERAANIVQRDMRRMFTGVTAATVRSCVDGQQQCVSTTTWYLSNSYSPGDLSYVLGSGGPSPLRTSIYDLWFAGAVCVEGICL